MNTNHKKKLFRVAFFYKKRILSHVRYDDNLKRLTLQHRYGLLTQIYYTEPRLSRSNEAAQDLSRLKSTLLDSRLIRRSSTRPDLSGPCNATWTPNFTVTLRNNSVIPRLVYRQQLSKTQQMHSNFLRYRTDNECNIYLRAWPIQLTPERLRSDAKIRRKRKQWNAILVHWVSRPAKSSCGWQMDILNQPHHPASELPTDRSELLLEHLNCFRPVCNRS